MNSNNKCFTCNPQPGFDHSIHHDHDCECCHMVPPTYHDECAVSGHMTENAFAISSGVPYIVDNSNVQYGSRLSVSEQVYTRVSQRKDLSCINLDAKFDMTSMIETNTVLNHYIEQIISNTNADLGGVLPIVKRDVTFKLYYSIKDNMGDEVYANTATVKSQELRYHATDVVDYYLTSNKNIIVVNFPSMDYIGMHTLNLNMIEVYADVVDTKTHIVDELNPYYQFTNNNTKIAIQHDSIEEVTPDSQILIASCDIGYSVPFQANVTTRLRLSFIAFMSMLISTRNTFNIWNAMNDTVKNMIDKLALSVATIDTRVTALEQKVGEMDTSISASLTALDTSVTALTSSLTDLSDALNTNVETLKTSIDNNSTVITVLDTRVTALEPVKPIEPTE